MTIEERVIRGFDALTDHYGPEWQDAIDVDKLDLKSTCQCILGQLEGDYWDVYYNQTWGSDKWTSALKYGKWASEHGFCSALLYADVYDYDDIDKEYDLLTQAWRNKLG